jgi:hypothetical protein
MPGEPRVLATAVGTDATVGVPTMHVDNRILERHRHPILSGVLDNTRLSDLAGPILPRPEAGPPASPRRRRRPAPRPQVLFACRILRVERYAFGRALGKKGLTAASPRARRSSPGGAGTDISHPRLTAAGGHVIYLAHVLEK